MWHIHHHISVLTRTITLRTTKSKIGLGILDVLPCRKTVESSISIMRKKESFDLDHLNTRKKKASLMLALYYATFGKTISSRSVCK